MMAVVAIGGHQVGGCKVTKDGPGINGIAI
jgi:hypothetical protein